MWIFVFGKKSLGKSEGTHLNKNLITDSIAMSKMKRSHKYQIKRSKAHGLKNCLLKELSMYIVT